MLQISNLMITSQYFAAMPSCRKESAVYFFQKIKIKIKIKKKKKKNLFQLRLNQNQYYSGTIIILTLQYYPSSTHT